MNGRTNQPPFPATSRGTPQLHRDEASWDSPLLPASAPRTGAPTNEEFDALTDLFLGEVSPSGAKAANGRPPVPSALPALSPPASNGRPKQVLRLAGMEEDLDLDEAFSPEAPVSRSPATVMEPPRRVPAAPSAAIVECIVLGHLPVLGAAWGAQYVREVALASGRPVAYVRLQRGYASVEVIGGSGESEQTSAAKTLEEALRIAASHTHRWVVRADAADEARLAASPLVRIVTLLTGVDEAAIVAAYGSVKALAANLTAPGVEPASGPLMRVAAMGAPAEKALPACKRLADAVSRFVGREVDAAVCSSRIASARPSEVLFTGRTDVEPVAALELLAAAAAEVRVVERAVPRPVAVATMPARIVPELEVEIEPDFAPEGVPVTPVRVITTHSPPPRVHATSVAAEAKPLAAPVAERDPRSAETLSDAPSALALLLPGLRPVSIRCPYAEGVEFAADRAGGLHLLSRVQHTADGQEERALSELIVAGAWADAHASMLAASLGQAAAVGGGGGAELHLFTDRPKASRRLLETSVNVHLLARVEVDGRSGWYCTDLN